MFFHIYIFHIFALVRRMISFVLIKSFIFYLFIIIFLFNLFCSVNVFFYMCTIHLCTCLYDDRVSSLTAVT